MSNNCFVYRKNPNLYNRLKKGILSGNLVAKVASEYVQLKREDNSLFNYLTSPESTFDGLSLSAARRLSLINQIESELPEDASPEVKNFIVKLKETLGSAAASGTKTLAINDSNAKIENIRVPKGTFSTRTLWRINKDTLQIPVLNKSLNQELINSLYSQVKELCLWNPETGTLIDSNSSLTDAIIEYRNKQYNIIRKFLGKTPVTLERVLTEQESKNYTNDMQEAWKKIQDLVNQYNGIIDIKNTQETFKSILEPVKAFYLLQDFDTVMQKVLGNFITINPKENNLVDASEDKYKRIKRSKKGQDFNDTFESSSGENLLDSILDSFIANTEYAPGKFLGKKFRTTFLVEIQNLLNNYSLDSSENRKDITDLKDALLDDDAPISQKYHALINLLYNNNKLTAKIGLDKCKALSLRLSSFQIAFDKKYKNASTKDKANLDRDYNVVHRLLDLLNQGANSFTQIDGQGLPDQIAAATKKKSKQYVRNHLKEALVRNINNGKIGLYSNFLQVGSNLSSELSEIFSDSAKEYLSAVTGLNFFSEDILKKFSQPQALQVLKNFISILNEKVQSKNFSSGIFKEVTDNDIDNLLNSLSYSEFYVQFSDIVVQENEYTEERLYNLDASKELPKTSVTILTAQVNRNIARLRSLVGNTSKNIILRNPNIITVSEVKYSGQSNEFVKDSDFIQHISFMGEVMLADKKLKKWVKLNKGELLQEQIGALYLRNILEHDILSFQIEAASDKSKVPVGNYNAKIKIDGQTLIERNLEELETLAWEQHNSYYTELENTLVSNWNTIIKELVSNPPTFKSLYDVKEFFDKNKIPVTRLNRIALAHPEIKFQKEILFSYSKDGNIEMNNSLLREIMQAHDKKSYITHNAAAFNNFKKYITQNGGISFLQNFLRSYSKCDSKVKDKLFQLFGIDSSKASQYFDNNGNFDYVKLCNDANVIEYFLKKYQLLYRICHEADLELCQKQYWCHAQNIGESLKEETVRIQKSEKRNNAESATWSPLMVGLKNGVGAKVRYAQVESLRSLTYNMFGNSDKLKAHDGAIFSSHVLRILEQNSSLAIDMSKTAKIIALNPDGYGMVQLKCADYDMDNAFIRNSIKNKGITDQTLDAKIALKKMLSPAKLSGDFFDNFRKSALGGNPNLGLEKVICYFNGRLAYLENYHAIMKDGYLAARWIYLDDNSDVDVETVAKTLQLETNGKSLKVSNLYDLWKFFGAEYSMGYDDNENVEFNDASQEYVAYLMCEFAPELKEVMIGKLVDPEASKSTQGLTNSREYTFTDNNEDLVTQTLEATQYGVQQDHSHETEESTIPALTQVITAIAFNGQNVKLVQQLYELLGKLTTESLEDIGAMAEATNRTKFYRKIGQMIYNNLSDSSVVSNALVILEKTLMELGSNKDLFASKALPLSDNQLFHTATANMLSKLNQAIRQRFSGISVVQNPAQGIQGIYEDMNHITYQYTQIVKEAMNAYKEGRAYFNAETALTPDEVAARYLNNEEKFRPTQITDANKHLLNVGYFITINGKITELKTPKELWSAQEALRKGADIQLLHNIARNLATTQIWWTEANGSTSNIWELASTKAVILEREAGEPEDNFNKNWHDANLKGLRDGDENGKYYYASDKDFKQGIKQYVSNINYRGGEEILPRIYKEKMGLHDSLSDIKQQGASYFENVVKQRVQLDPSITLTGTDFALTTNNSDIIFKINKDVENNGTIIQEGQISFIYDSDGVLIEKLYLPNNDDITVNISKNSIGKNIITIGLPVDDTTKLKEFTKIVNGIDYNRWYGSSIGQDGVWENIAVKQTEWSDAEIKQRAQEMYVSFLTMLKTISARIPSQSFQSFLSNETVAFTEDDSNNGYMNLYEMYFQGSDYDIDHAYTMIFEINDAGLIEGATNFTSPEAVIQSLVMPEPNRDAIINILAPEQLAEGQVNNTEAILEILKNSKSKNDLYNALNDLAKSQETPLTFIEINPLGENAEKLRKLITEINSYNYEVRSQAAQRNSIMAGIRIASQDLANLRASQVPMESKPVNACIDNSVKEFGAAENKTIYMDADPSHIIDFQYQGAIGKEGVGISANSIKATGAIQQIINEKHQTHPETAGMPDMHLNLHFNLGAKNINEVIFRVPNTPVDKSSFIKQVQVAFSGQQHPLQFVFDTLITEGSYSPKTGKEKQFVRAYNTLLKTGVKKPSFIDTLYEMTLNEQNVADLESIFISLCTDNAKELQLYRIAGIPSLLNLPLTMIALGMDIQDVTDICVKYIVPLMDDLNKSSLFEKHKQNVEDLIKDHIKLSENDADARDSYISLLQIYNAAQELRFISGFFKINQGTSVRYAETQEFLKNFDKILSKKDITLEDGAPVTYEKIFTEGKDYQDKVIAAYEAKKTAFNVMDIVLNSPHFYSQLQETYKVYKRINDNIGVAKIASQIYSNLQDSEDFNEANSTRVIQVVQNYFLTDALKKLTNVSFDKESTRNIYGNWDRSLPGNIEIGVSSAAKIEFFLNFMENGFIPFLKRNFENNFFVQSLNLNSRTNKYELPFSRDTKGDILSKLEINQASLAFSDICAIESGLKTLDGVSITYGDLLYFYSIITNQNRINPTSSVIESAQEKGSTLKPITTIKNNYSEIDRLTGISSLNPLSITSQDSRAEYDYAKNYIQRMVNAVTPYVKARLSDGTHIVNGNLIYQIDPQGSYLYTMTPPKIKSDTGFPIEESSVNKMFQLFASIAGTGTQINNVIINPINSTFTVSFTNPGVLGTAQEQTVDVKYSEHNGKLTDAAREDIYKAILPYFSSLQASLEQALSGESGALQSGKISDKIAKENYENLNKIPGFTDWINGERNIVILSKVSPMKSHVETIGDKKVVVLNQNELMLGENLENLLLNLYLDSVAETSGSEVERLIRLLSLYGIETNRSALEKTLSEQTTKEILKNNNVIKRWVADTLNSQISEEVKKTARVTLNAFTESLQYQDIYYRELDTKEASKHTPVIGDIFEYNDSESTNYYIYLGKDSNNRLILQNLQQAQDIQVLSAVTKDIGWICKKTPKIITNFNALNRDLYKKGIYSPLGFKETTRDNIRLGDKVKLNGQEVIIYNVIYTQNGNVKAPEFVYLDPITDDFKTFQLSEKETCEVQRRIVLNDKNNSEQDEKNVEIGNASTDVKKKIAKSMVRGTKFTILGENDPLIFFSYKDGYIETNNHRLLLVDNLKSVYNFDISTITDVSGLNQLSFMIFPVEGSSLTKNDIIEYLFKSRRFAERENAIADFENKSKQVILKKYQLKPKVEFTIGGKKLLFNQFVITADTEMQGNIDQYSIIEPNDYIEIKPTSIDDGYSMLKVLSLNSDGTYTVIKQTQTADNKNTLRTTVESIRKEDLKGNRLYKYNRNAQNQRIRYSSTVNPQIVNSYDRAHALLDFFADKFNTTVDIINDVKANWFARVNGGIVQINIAKKPEDMSMESYILEQGVHEFTHLAVAYLRATNMDGYLQLINKMRSVENLLPKEITENENYGEGVDQMEEYLVRSITHYLTQKENSGENTQLSLDYDAIIDSGDLDNMINELFGDFFDVAQNFIENKTIDSANIKAFEDTRKMSITNLRRNMISNEILNRIDINCD